MPAHPAVLRGADLTVAAIPEAAKADLRKTAFAARKAARAALGPCPDAATAALLAALGPAAVVAGYRPIRTEIDPTPAMTRLIAAGARVCVPVIEGAGRPLTFREWTPDAPMTTGEFGAEIPAEGEDMTPGALIVPLVAFDDSCARLGYGGGFYDRTLERLRAAGPVRAVGFAYSAQRLPDLPQEPTDQPLDAVATEAGVRERRP